MQSTIVAILGWTLVALLAGAALSALAARRGETRPTSSLRRRLGLFGGLPVLLALTLGTLGLLPGTGGDGGIAPDLARTLLLVLAGGMLGAVLTPAITIATWRARSPEGFARAGSIITIAILITLPVGGLIGALLGLMLGLVW